MVKVMRDTPSEMIQDKLSMADPWYQLVLKMLHSVNDDAGMRLIIEVGCGIGGFLTNIANERATVIGLDISLKAINTAKELVKRFGLQDKVDLVVGDAQFLPFKEQISDIVICSETLEHVPDYEKAFGELVRITSSSGYLCLTVPNFFSSAFFENVILLIIGQPGYVKSRVCVEKEHVFHVFKLRRLLVKENVKVISIRSVDFLHVPPRIRRILKLGQTLRNISNQLEDFFEAHNSPLRLTGANIGVLARKE